MWYQKNEVETSESLLRQQKGVIRNVLESFFKSVSSTFYRISQHRISLCGSESVSDSCLEYRDLKAKKPS